MKKNILMLGLILIACHVNASNLYVFKNKEGEVLLTNRVDSDKNPISTEKTDLTEYKTKVNITYYADTNLSKDYFKKRDEAQALLAKKPGARIGMTSSQVKKSTNWGEPNKINETLDSSGSFQQWVYGDEYLYFKNGKLVSISTSR